MSETQASAPFDSVEHALRMLHSFGDYAALGHLPVRTLAELRDQCLGIAARGPVDINTIGHTIMRTLLVDGPDAADLAIRSNLNVTDQVAQILEQSEL